MPLSQILTRANGYLTLPSHVLSSSLYPLLHTSLWQLSARAYNEHEWPPKAAEKIAGYRSQRSAHTRARTIKKRKEGSRARKTDQQRKREREREKYTHIYTCASHQRPKRQFCSLVGMLGTRATILSLSFANERKKCRTPGPGFFQRWSVDYSSGVSLYTRVQREKERGRENSFGAPFSVVKRKFHSFFFFFI